MKLPIVAIVGRPNVGKSSLFNLLAGKRISIVDPTAGVTRDRISTTLNIGERYFDLMDTGGMGIEDMDDLTADVEHQISNAIDQASVVLFLVSVRDGVTPLDQTVAERLRVLNKPVIFVANKADDHTREYDAGDLYRLGYGPPLLVSANSSRGKEELVQAIFEKLPTDAPTDAPPETDLKLAIVGRRNVGKSTFINSLAEADRVIVSEVPGTTRDSVDVRFERDGLSFLAIDTAGVRKRKSLANDIEFYGLHRAERSIRRADVVLHFFDPRMKISRVDKQLAEYILEHHKPAIFVVNKWDLASDRIPTQKWSDYLRKIFPMLEYVPIAFITAKNGRNVFRLLNLCQELQKQAGKRASTGELNRLLREAMLANSPPVRFNRVPKLYYATQVATHPPTVVMVSNAPDLFDDTYVRYLTKAIRDGFGFAEVPVKVMLKTKGETSARAEANAMPDDEDLHETKLSDEDEPDGLEPRDVTDEEEAAAPPPPPKPVPPQPAPPPAKRKKKKPPETWNV